MEDEIAWRLSLPDRSAEVSLRNGGWASIVL